jgi:hypothetical protein
MEHDLRSCRTATTDAFEFDLATNHLTLLTGFPNAGFLRAQYLANGGLFLIGNRYFDDTFSVLGTRVADQEMWVLPKGGSAAIPLNNSIYEGITISTQSNLIAFAENFQSTPDNFAFNESAIYTAEIVYDGDGNPSLTNKREIRRGMAPECTLEPQDFHNCYPQLEAGYGSDIFKVNLETPLGIGVYLGFMWTGHIEVGRSPDDNRNIWIVYMIVMVACMLVYSTSRLVTSHEPLEEHLIVVENCSHWIKTHQEEFLQAAQQTKSTNDVPEDGEHVAGDSEIV